MEERLPQKREYCEITLGLFHCSSSKKKQEEEEMGRVEEKQERKALIFVVFCNAPFCLPWNSGNSELRVYSFMF